MKIKIKVINILTTAIVLINMSGCSPDNKENEYDTENFNITCIDVGKGDCILAKFNDKSLMIDTGYAETAEDVLSFLKRNNIKKLDYLIITHYDKDHVGGAAEIAENIEITKIYLPDCEGRSEYYETFMNVIEKKNLDANQVSDDVELALGNVKFKIFSSDVPYELTGKEWNDNDISLVISAVYNKDSYLFAGDIEKDGIKSYLSKIQDNFDVLKMPHHGEKEKNSDDFIENVQPQIALITDSTDSPADDKILDMLEKSDADIYRTSKNGNISILSSGDGNYKINTEK